MSKGQKTYDDFCADDRKIELDRKPVRKDYELAPEP